MSKPIRAYVEGTEDVLTRTSVPVAPAHHLTDGLWLTRGRISDMTSVATIGTPPASSFDDAARVEVRLTLLHPEPAQPPMLDGAWWPRSSSLSDELPGLITELRHRDLPITRVTYNPELWDPAPRRLRVDGRVIRLGWFRSIDRHLLCLTGGYGDDRLELLVVPPDTPAVDEITFVVAWESVAAAIIVPSPTVLKESGSSS